VHLGLLRVLGPKLAQQIEQRPRLGDLPGVAVVDDQVEGPLRTAAIEPRHLQRDGDLSPEFQRLVEGAPGQCLAGDAGGEAQIVLDPGRRAGLSAEGALVEHEHREALGGGVDRGGEAGRARPDHGHVVHRLRIEVGGDAKAHTGLGVGRPLQHRPVRADHQRQVLRLDTEALHDGAAALVGRSIQYGVGIAVAGEKTLQPHEVRRARSADQHRAGTTLLNEPDAAQDEGAHEHLADLRRADHERAEMGGIEGQSGATLWAGPARGQRGAAGKLAELAGDVTGAVGGDSDLLVEPVPAHHLDGAREHQPGRRLALADGEDDLTRCEGPLLAAGKALCRLDLRQVEHRKHLVTTGLDETHRVSPVGGELPQLDLKGCQGSSSS
jgi:hypothetical protein